MFCLEQGARELIILAPAYFIVVKLHDLLSTRMRVTEIFGEISKSRITLLHQHIVA
jgi:RecA/RadA recombinase